MRNNFIVKASLFTLILAYMAIGTIAIAEVMKKDKFVEKPVVVNQLWHYRQGAPTQGASYSSDPVADCGTGDDVICQIFAPADPANPDQPLMSSNVVNDINDALTTGEDNSTVLSFREL